MLLRLPKALNQRTSSEEPGWGWAILVTKPRWSASAWCGCNYKLWMVGIKIDVGTDTESVQGPAQLKSIQMEGVYLQTLFSCLPSRFIAEGARRACGTGSADESCIQTFQYPRGRAAWQSGVQKGPPSGVQLVPPESGTAYEHRFHLRSVKK